MKASNIGFWIIGAVAAWMGWIFLDMSQPVQGRSGTAAFDSVRTSPVPVLVEFYADWCGPCRAIAPLVDEFTKEMDGKATVVRVNVDSDRAIAAQSGVRSIPTFIAYKDGKEVARRSGTIPKTLMREMLGL